MYVPEQVAIQATQYVISLLEDSKLRSEESLDSLPGIYCVIDASGNILKGNRNLASLLGVDYEHLLGKPFSKLFLKEAWENFLENCQAGLAGGAKAGGRNEFRVDLTLAEHVTKNYLWFVTPFLIDRPGFPNLFSVIGHDVTEFTSVTREKARMQYELSTAKVVQETFFPPSVANFYDSTVVSHFETASECGGDWFYYRQLGDNLLLWIGDVTGHGVSAALVVSAVHSVISVISENDISPTKTLSLLNRALCSMAGNPLAMTFLAATVNLKTREFSYACAGHEPIIVLEQGRSTFSLRDLNLLQGEASTPLGVNSSMQYKEEHLVLNTGDKLLFYTDGAYDIVNPAGALWSRSAFHRNLARLATKHRDPNELVQNLIATMNAYRQGTPLKDDLTFFMFQM